MKCSVLVVVVTLCISGCLPSSGSPPYLSAAQPAGRVPQGAAYLYDLGISRDDTAMPGSPDAVDVDPLGNILVVDGRNRIVLRFDRSGRRIAELAGATAFFSPRDVFCSEELGVYVLGSGDRIIELYDLRGRACGSISEQERSGRPSSFERISIGSSGRVYLTDRGGGRVALLSRTGEVQSSIYPQSPAEFHPSGIAVWKDELVFVSDPVSGTIIVFDGMGGTVRSWKTDGGSSKPSGLAADVSGNLFAADCGTDRVLVYNKEGKLLFTVGARGEGPGSFRCPVDVAVSRDGVLYVADRGNSRIQAFKVQYGPPGS